MQAMGSARCACSGWAALALAALAGAACAQPSAPIEQGLTGMWHLTPSEYERREVMPLTAAYQAMDDARRHGREQGGQVLDANDRKCLPVGMPIFMANEFAIEILETPGRITLLGEYSTLPRTVYLNETSHPKGLERSWNGHSIGHWEGSGSGSGAGRTLVVDTVNFNDRIGPVINKGIHSPTTRITERFHQVDADTLIDDMTFEDPNILTKPWTEQLTYHRLPPGSELWEYACEVDAPGWSERFVGDPAAGIKSNGK